MFELDYDTKYILAVIEFDYHSMTGRNIPNDLREAFMGLSQSKERPKARGTPDFPRKIKERCEYEREIIYPVHWSLIKKPVLFDLPGERKYKKRNTAVGAIILYKYLGLLRDYKRCCSEITEFIEELKKNGKPAHFAIIKDIKIIIGYDWKDVPE